MSQLCSYLVPLNFSLPWSITWFISSVTQTTPGEPFLRCSITSARQPRPRLASSAAVHPGTVSVSTLPALHGSLATSWNGRPSCTISTVSPTATSWSSTCWMALALGSSGASSRPLRIRRSWYRPPGSPSKPDFALDQMPSPCSPLTRLTSALIAFSNAAQPSTVLPVYSKGLKRSPTILPLRSSIMQTPKRKRTSCSCFGTMRSCHPGYTPPSANGMYMYSSCLRSSGSTGKR
mmetsp:Transcript_80203/g.240217  ORF Transcript_80203/g.240217 Transcript_80203/m.240217 type:complete len:234 (-) Transcript_80203:168-869(-)